MQGWLESRKSRMRAERIEIDLVIVNQRVQEDALQRIEFVFDLRIQIIGLSLPIFQIPRPHFLLRGPVFTGLLCQGHAVLPLHPPRLAGGRTVGPLPLTFRCSHCPTGSAKKTLQP